MKNNYPQFVILIKSIVYTQIGVMLAIFLIYLADNQYDNPFENMWAVVNKVFFISILPTIFTMLWIIFKKYTQKDEIKVIAAISIMFFINTGILMFVDLPFYNSDIKLSGGSLAVIISLFIIPKLLPKQ